MNEWMIEWEKQRKKWFSCNHEISDAHSIQEANFARR